MIIKRVILLLGLLSGAAQLPMAHCQLPAGTSHTTLFGIGHVNHLDTYLSPVEYKGTQTTYLHETFRTLRHAPHVVFQTTTQGEFSYSQNHAETAHDFGGSVRYDFGWGRQWKNIPWRNLNLAAMGMAGGDLGFLYNNRNGNNPAQARANLRLTLALRADYSFKVKRQVLELHYQAHLPLLGMGFMPRYGQSYYDIFDRGHYDHNLIATHLGNALSLRQLLAVDIPVRHAHLRLGYLSDLRQLQANGIKQHQYTRSFVIGYTRHIFLSR